MTFAEHLPDEDLVAYDDHDLPAGERHRIGRHLAGCPDCRKRLDDFRWVDRVLKSPAQKPGDRTDPHEMLNNLKRRAEGGLSMPWMPKTAAAIGLVVILLVLVGQPITSTASDGVTRFIQFTSDIRGSGQSSAPASEGPPGVLYVPPEPGAWDPDDLSFSAVAPQNLPSGLHLQGGAIPSDNRLSLTYQAEQGDDEFRILITEGPVGEMAVRASPDDSERTVVDGIEVLMGLQERTRQVAWMFWERGELAFEVIALNDPAGELTTEKALKIVAALNQALDRTSDE